MKEALKLALEALEIEEAQTHYPSQWLLKAIATIKEALAQPEQEMVSYERFMGVEKELADMTAEFMRVAKQVAQPAPVQQEPVAWFWKQGFTDGYEWKHMADNQADADKFLPHQVIPLYTNPPAQRTWVGLTDEEFDDLRDNNFGISPLISAVEAKLKEKNK